MAEAKKPAFYREWMDSVFARDIQRLFGFRDMNRFNARFEYVLRQSGGQLEALVAKGDDPWITPSEKTGLTDTPNDDETIAPARYRAPGQGVAARSREFPLRADLQCRRA